MRRPNFFNLLLSLPISLLDLVVAQQSPLTPIPQPSLDLSSFGQVTLGGDFSGISIYQYSGQNPSSSNSSLSPGENAVYVTLPNGDISPLASVPGTISSLCTTSSALYIGGNFSSLTPSYSSAVLNASNIASYNLSTLTWSPLDDRALLGSVSTLFCDDKNSLVYVGGNFQSGGSNNAIVWNETAGRWINLPFGGFDGQVNSILEESGGNVLFGGMFDALGNGTTASLSDKQVINLVTANVCLPTLHMLFFLDTTLIVQVTSDATTTTPGFENPEVLFCNNGTDGPGTTWLLQDNTPGDLTVLGNYGYRPTRLRLQNTHYQGRGTKTFRFVALPIDGIMNFTYTDPTTGQSMSCDATCPLSNDTSITYQDFEFVNVIGMNGFTLFISDWYGSGAGLTSLELFTDDIVAYADNSFNEPLCLVPELGSQSFFQGGEFIAKSSFPATSASYLSSSAGGSVTLEPSLLQTGNYSIRLFTPGCIADNTCDQRGIVNVTFSIAANEPIQSELIYQTNNYDKYDTLYEGRVEATSESFRPKIIISAAAGQPSSQNIVAQKVQFLSLGDQSSSGTEGGEIGFGDGSLNGMFEYAPLNWTASTSAANMTFSAGFDVAGEELGFDANVVSIVQVTTSGGAAEVYVAGQFSSTELGLENILMVTSTGQVLSLAQGGLNGPIEDMVQYNSTLYMGGTFTATANSSSPIGLNNVASYNTVNNTWIPLGQGLNGNVTSVVTIALPTANETVIAFSGTFTEILGATSITVPGFAIWIPSKGNWAEILGEGAPYANGFVSAETSSTNGTVYIAGSISAWQGNGAQSLIGLGSSGLNSIPLGPPVSSSSSNTPTNSTISKRSLNSLDNITSTDVVITAGAYYTGNNSNITIVAGTFNVPSATNLAFINGSNNNAVTTLPSGLSSNASIYALLVSSNRLYIGGSFTGTINSSPINALVFYDFSTANFATTQPPSLTSSSSTPIVNALAARPSSSQIVVGGAFTSAGSLPCSAVCVYDSGASQWLRPGNTDLEGEVSQIVFTDANTAVVVGNISFGGNQTFVGTYSFSTSTWSSVNMGLTGPVETILVQTSTEWFLAGENSTGVYFGLWNGQQYQDLSTFPYTFSWTIVNV